MQMVIIEDWRLRNSMKSAEKKSDFLGTLLILNSNHYHSTTLSAHQELLSDG